MRATDLIRRLHQHRIWVNQQLLKCARQLDASQLRTPLAIGQGCVWRTLTHLWAAEYIWLEALLGNEQAVCPGDAPGKLPGNQEGHAAVTTLDELAARWRELDHKWHDYLSRLTDPALDRIIRRVSWSGIHRETTQADVLLHVCAHAHYTAAQMINMLRQLGCSPLPDFMLITLARQEAASQAT